VVNGEHLWAKGKKVQIERIETAEAGTSEEIVTQAIVTERAWPRSEKIKRLKSAPFRRKKINRESFQESVSCARFISLRDYRKLWFGRRFRFESTRALHG
jgi:hypothetical protein